MAQKNKTSLGRGLDSLIISDSLNVSEEEQLTRLAVAKIRVGRYQARVKMDDSALQELAESIKVQGVIQPVIVRAKGADEFELIAGERRWRAAQLAGLDEIPVIIKQASDKVAMAIGLIENIQRRDLNPIEQACGFRRLIDEFDLTHEMVAQAVGCSRSAISNSLRLLKLPEIIQEMVFNGQLEMGHARALVGLPEDKQLKLANKAIQNAWSVREMEKHSQKNEQAHQPHIVTKNINPDVIRLSEALTEQLGLMAEIKTNDNKKGKIVLHFSSAQEFQDIMWKLNIKI